MSDEVIRALVKEGVFKGMHGLEGFANASEFWEKQPYDTRLYYGEGAFDYLHRSVLRAAIEVIRKSAPTPKPLDLDATG